jgi:hypothetical protein
MPKPQKDWVETAIGKMLRVAQENYDPTKAYNYKDDKKPKK